MPDITMPDIPTYNPATNSAVLSTPEANVGLALTVTIPDGTVLFNRSNHKVYPVAGTLNWTAASTPSTLAAQQVR